MCNGVDHTISTEKDLKLRVGYQNICGTTNLGGYYHASFAILMRLEYPDPSVREIKWKHGIEVEPSTARQHERQADYHTRMLPLLPARGVRRIGRSRERVAKFIWECLGWKVICGTLHRIEDDADLQRVLRRLLDTEFAGGLRIMSGSEIRRILSAMGIPLPPPRPRTPPPTDDQADEVRRIVREWLRGELDTHGHVYLRDSSAIPQAVRDAIEWPDDEDDGAAGAQPGAQSGNQQGGGQ